MHCILSQLINYNIDRQGLYARRLGWFQLARKTFKGIRELWGDLSRMQLVCTAS